MSWFDGQHALVTGGGSGIGAAVASKLKQSGAKLTLVGRGEQRLAAMADSLGAAYQVADVTNREEVEIAFSNAEKKQGAVGILINNAGAASAVPFSRMDPDHWDNTIAVNLTGVFNCTKAVVPSMLEAGSGRVINIASTAGLTGYAYVSAYCAAKHGVIGLTRALALEYARKGITVNAVCPGYTDTDIITDAVDKIVSSTGRTSEQALNEFLKSNPQGRLVKPEEVAATITWLCEQESINGQSIAVAGGEVM